MDIKWLRRKYVVELLQPQEIAKAAGVSRRTVERRLKKYGIERNLKSSTFPEVPLQRLYVREGRSLLEIAQVYKVDLEELAQRVLQLGLELRERYMDKSWLEEEYQQKDHSTYEIARGLGTTNKVISDWLNRFGISTKAKTEPYQDPEWLYHQHYEENKSLKEIARQQGKNPATIQYWFHKHNIPIKGGTYAGHKDRENAPYRNEITLRELCGIMSDEQVANELGVNRRNVQYWRSKYGIKARSLSEATTLRHGRNQAPYKDKKWLEHQYTEAGKSTYQIADELGVSPVTIRRWLLRHGVELRSPDESYFLTHRNYLRISPYLQSMIEGELLGDGSIIRASGRSAFYSHGSKYKDYVLWLSKEFKKQGMRQSGKIRKAVNYLGTEHVSITYEYHSLAYPELLEIRKRFYPGEGKKIVPSDLTLDPIKVRQWYIGDGRLIKSNRQRPAIVLYTCAFDPVSTQRLMDQLTERGFEVTLQPSRNQIYIRADSVHQFMDYIGPCPKQIIHIYGYKWNL